VKKVRKRKKKAAGKLSRFRKYCLGSLKVLVLLILVAIPVFLWGLVRIGKYFEIGRLRTENPKTTALMQYRIEEARRKGAADPRISQFWVPLDRVSGILKTAVVTAEDDLFYKHKGFDTEAMREALELNLRLGRPARGASTITQQLAKNLFLSPEKSMARKLREAVCTVVLERRLSKDRILELYLNVIELGDAVFGVEAASRFYFHKRAGEIGPAEAALMATAIPSPRRRDPRCPTPSHKKRAKTLLHRLRNEGALDREALGAALLEVDALSCGGTKGSGSQESIDLKERIE
jgi:monofunctional biosynthetic peptidoglycan transglycosylase